MSNVSSKINLYSSIRIKSWATPPLFPHDQPHGTIDAGVIAESGLLDGGLAAGAEGILLVVLAEGGKQHIACAGNAAADHEHLGVGGGGDGGQCHAEGVGHLVHLTGGKGVAIAGSIKDVLVLSLYAVQFFALLSNNFAQYPLHLTFEKLHLLENMIF